MGTDDDVYPLAALAADIAAVARVLQEAYLHDGEYDRWFKQECPYAWERVLGLAERSL